MAQVKNLLVFGDIRFNGSINDYNIDATSDQSTAIVNGGKGLVTQNAVYNYVQNTAISTLSNYKMVQTTVSDPTASGSATAFIDTITQDTQGKITVTKKNIPTVGSASLTIYAGTNNKGSFSANATSDVSITINASDLGIANSMEFVGVSTTDPKGASGATVAGHTTWKKGDVVLYDTKEYVLNGDTNVAANWVELGDEGAYSLKGHTHTFSWNGDHKHNIPTISGGSHSHSFSVTTALTNHSHSITDAGHSHSFSVTPNDHAHTYDKVACQYDSVNEDLKFVLVSNVSTGSSSIIVSGNTDANTTGITVKNTSFGITNASTGTSTITISNVSTADTTITVSGTTGTASA